MLKLSLKQLTELLKHLEKNQCIIFNVRLYIDSSLDLHFGKYNSPLGIFQITYRHRHS